MIKRSAESFKITDPVCRDLYIRYNMDPAKWQSTSRGHFPFNTSLNLIIGIPLVVPLLFLLLDFVVVDKDYGSLWTIVQTIMVSIAAYYLSDMLILGFQDTLVKKGLFGRDLNKAGVQKEKKPV